MTLCAASSINIARRVTGIPRGELNEDGREFGRIARAAKRGISTNLCVLLILASGHMAIERAVDGVSMSEALAVTAGIRIMASLFNSADDVGTQSKLVRILAGTLPLEGNLDLPGDARGLVIFVHGSGSSRNSPRNRYVAEVLQQAGFATLLFDLLTNEEEAVDRHTAELRFDIPFLTNRLLQVTEWVKGQAQLQTLRIGYFGASTGAAAALKAAAQDASAVRSVVSRGGRPDLAGEALSRVKVPTLLIVGGDDLPVIEMNRQAMVKLNCEKQLAIVPGATHLFEERGALERMARLARDWLALHLVEKENKDAVS